MKTRTFQNWLPLFAIAAVLLLVGAPASADERALAEHRADGGCDSTQIDLTSIPIQALLASAHSIEPLATPAVSYSNGFKRSTSPALIQIAQGEIEVTVNCSATCTGNGCGILGCDIVYNNPDTTSCTPCTCTGDTCTGQCTCVKTVTIGPKQTRGN